MISTPVTIWGGLFVKKRKNDAGRLAKCTMLKETLSSVALTALAGTLVAPAYAQEDAPAYAQEDDEIIVTARKKEERLSDVPAALSIATGEKLKSLGIREASDLEALTPGFVFRPSPQGSPIFQIRGVGFFEEAIGISPTVTTYVDQAPLPFSVMAQGAIFDVEIGEEIGRGSCREGVVQDG